MAASDYPAMMRLVTDGLLQPERLVERTVGLPEAADLLPGFDRATVAGLTLVDPRR
jgi:alcohol dehydrogenase